MFRRKHTILALLGLLVSGVAVAQTADGGKFYKLDFAVKEVEGGKTVNSRIFSAVVPVQEGPKSAPPTSIRAGGKTPVTNVAGGVSFIDLGVNLDLRELREVAAGEISVYVAADISTLAQDSPSTPGMVRQNKWVGTVLTAVKKPTVVFASDDLTSKRQMQLEVTATPVK